MSLIRKTMNHLPFVHFTFQKQYCIFQTMSCTFFHVLGFPCDVYIKMFTLTREGALGLCVTICYSYSVPLLLCTLLRMSAAKRASVLQLIVKYSAKKGNRAAERKFGVSEKLVRHWRKAVMENTAS
ncbi:hypothetical protein NL108_009722 [Boleophthalmus pectinirostris]|nr:hypothetical protein NL108_009722 [Boleophthalmus pectinirostris]